LDNCVVLLREVRAQGYTGGYSILKEYVHPFRRKHQPQATMRFETGPGEQAQVDWGNFSYVTEEGHKRQVWAFVMVLSWSRAIYVEFVPRADVATFIRCHVNAFEHLGGIPRRCLYDNAKVVVLGREDDGKPRWNPRLLDFALRVGFDTRLCQPYRPQTKGKVESGIKYVRRNFWPSARFVDLAELNRQAHGWSESVAGARIHGTTRERPGDRLVKERAQLLPMPEMGQLAPFLREERKVGRDGYVQWERSWYGAPWSWAGKAVEVMATGSTVEIWARDDRLAVHPRARRPGQRFTLPGQWDGLRNGNGRPPKEPLAVQVATVEVERRSLDCYEVAAAGGVR
jgi:transposase